MCHILSKLPRLPPNAYTPHPNPKGILGMAYLTAGTTGVAHRRPGRLTGAPPSFTGGDRVLCVVTPGVFSLASRLALSRPPSPQSALLDVENRLSPQGPRGWPAVGVHGDPLCRPAGRFPVGGSTGRGWVKGQLVEVPAGFGSEVAQIGGNGVYMKREPNGKKQREQS